MPYLRLKLAVGLTCALALGLVAASCDQRKNQPNVSGEERIVFVAKTFKNPYFKEMEGGFREEAGKLKNIVVDVRAGQEEGDISGQRQILEAVLLAHQPSAHRTVRGIVLAPTGSGNELTDIVRRVNEANIPIVIVDTPINRDALVSAGAKITAFVGSSNKQGGSLAADLISGQLKQGGTILLLSGVRGQQTAADRRDGFTERLTEIGTKTGAKYEVVERVANWTRSEALAAVNSLLAGHIVLDAVFGSNDQMALGAAEAIRSTTVTLSRKPIIVGFDAVAEARQAVTDGVLFATLAQNPRAMGSEGVKIIEAVHNGGTYTSEVLIPVVAVTK